VEYLTYGGCVVVNKNKNNTYPVLPSMVSKCRAVVACLLMAMSILISPAVLAQVPVAHAGGDANGKYPDTDPGVNVTFDASASTDADGNATIVRYLWFFKHDNDANDPGEIVPGGAQPTVTKSFTVPGTYTATVAVTDETGLTNVARATIYVKGAGGSTGGGQMLFNTYCIGCHGDRAAGGTDAIVHINLGPQPAGNGLGTDWQVIKTALSPVGPAEMVSTVTKSLSLYGRGMFTDTELQSIANYIAGIPDPGGGGGGSGGDGTTPTGASIFLGKCVFCHDADGIGGDPATITAPFVAGPGIMGVTATEILAAVKNGSMTNVTVDSTEAGLLADYLKLSSVTHPTTAPGLFGAVCARCHGTDATGGAATAQQPGPGILNASVSEIMAVLGTTGPMKNIVPLSSDEVLALAGYLKDPVLRPTTSQQLFDSLCSRCHGANGWGNNLNALVPGPGIMGASSTEITFAAGKNAMANVTVNSTESGLLETYLATGVTRPASTDGTNLYSGLCARCHGNNAWGSDPMAQHKSPGIRGVTASEITVAVNTTTGTMANVDAFPAEISAIFDKISMLPPPDPTNGALMYRSTCARCHGDTALGGTSVAQNPGPGLRAVRASPNEVAQSLGQLKMTNITSQLVGTGGPSITAFIGGLTKPDNGADLFNGYCARCHGADATGNPTALDNGGNITCSIPSNIQSAVSSSTTEGMPWLSGIITDANANGQNDYDLISGYLNTLGCP